MRYSRRLSEKYDISVRMAKRYIRDGFVTLNGSVMKKDLDSAEGELLLDVPTERPAPNPSDYIIREFDHIVYFDKPAGIHTELQKPDDPLTMEDVLREYSSEHRFVSRLDLTTDGVLAAVREGFFIFETKKTYLAYVYGTMQEPVTIDNILDASKKKTVKVTDRHGGNKTTFTPLEITDKYTLVQAEMEQAGRHQLRAYLAHLGHPIIGDGQYGESWGPRIMLHCKETYINRFPGVSKITDDFLKSIADIKI